MQPTLAHLAEIEKLYVDELVRQTGYAVDMLGYERRKTLET